MEISKAKEDLEYEKAKLQAEEYYKSIKSVKCPAFNGEEVFFTSEGFNHILYRIKKQERELRAQLTRFKLLPLAKELLAKTNTFQECEEYSEQVLVSRHKKKEWRPVFIKDWGFVAVIHNTRVKVVVKRVGKNGQRQFHSVIPYWHTKYYRDIKIIQNTSRTSVVEDI